MLHSGLMILEANLNYRIGSSFDTITKDLLGKGWNVVNGISIAFVLYILTYAYISASGSILHHTFAEMSLNVLHGQLDLVCTAGSVRGVVEYESCQPDDSNCAGGESHFLPHLRQPAGACTANDLVQRRRKQCVLCAVSADDTAILSGIFWLSR